MQRKTRRSLAIGTALVCCVTCCAAGAAIAEAPGTPPLIDQTGDNPLVTLERFTGNVDVVVDVVAQAGPINPSGTFSVSGIPVGATVLRAWFITTSFAASAIESASATFAGSALGTQAPTSEDPGGGRFARSYRFDVTALVPGNGSYGYSVTGTGNTFGDALVVVYEDSGLPSRTIVINDGAESLLDSTTSTAFDGMSGGDGRLIVFVEADNPGGTERIDLNGVTIAGPGDIFAANNGSFASLVETPVVVADGTNTVDIDSRVDWIGVHLAVLVGAGSPTLGMVADNDSSTVVVFNADTDTVVASIPITTFPGLGDCSITRDGSLGFVTDFDSNVWVVDLTADPPSLAGGANPIPISNFGEDTSISPDGQFVVVCDGDAPQPISVIDIATRSEISTFDAGTDCNSVEVCGDGAVLFTSVQTGNVRRLTLDGSGDLTDTGEVLFSGASGFEDGPNNVVCAPGDRSGVVIRRAPLEFRSFTTPGLGQVDSRPLGGDGYGLAAVFDADRERVYVRSGGGGLGSGAIDVYDYGLADGTLGAAPALTFAIGSTPTFYGMDQVALHPDGSKLYVGESGTLNAYDPDTGQLLASITDPAISVPTGICFPTATTSPSIPLAAVAEETPSIGADSRTGSAVAAAGDLNGGAGTDQSFQDWLAGAPGFEDAAAGVPVEAGAAIVYLGSDVESERTEADIIYTGEAAHDRAGVAVAGDFDWNGDGIPDILVGAEQVDRTGSAGVPVGGGKVYLILFDPTDAVNYPLLNDGDPSTTGDRVSLSLVGQPGGIPGIVFTGAAVGDQAGFSVAGGGLVNADNLQDIVVGAPGVDNVAGADAGAAYVVFGDGSLSGPVDLSRVANGMSDQVGGVVYQGEAAGDALGFSVAFPGDVVEPDGEDIAMGAPFNDPVPPTDATPLVDAGSAYLGAGGTLSSGIIEVCDLGGGGGGARIQGDQAGMNLGWSVAGAGDSLQNGSADFIVGAPNYDTVTPTDDIFADTGLAAQTARRLQSGIIEVCDLGGGGGGGSTDGPAIEGVRYVGAAAGDQLGSAVAGIGDATANDVDDVAMGAPFTDPEGLMDAGTLYIAEGRTEEGIDLGFNLGIIEVCDLGGGTGGRQLNGSEPGQQTGASVAGTGDVDGDGEDDFVTGSPGKDEEDGSVAIVLESETLATEAVPINTAPTADASASQTLAECDGGLAGPVLLNGSLSFDPDSSPGTNDDIVLFEWFENGVLIASGEQATVHLGLGTRDVTLVVTDDFGDSSSDVVAVTVRDSVSPGGAITAPAGGICTGLPVTVTDDYSDICDPALTRSYDPPPGPTYSAHGDYNVTLTVTDDGGNQAGDSVFFTVDTVLPVVTILEPASRAHIEDDLPLDVVFDAADDDGASGGVVRETIWLDTCLVYDGDTFGDGDGLLQDETVRLSRDELCRIADQCGFTSLEQPVLRVDATDCAGNLGSASVTFSGSVALKPGLCAAIATAMHEPDATYASWDSHQGVTHYDVVRGDVAGLRRDSAGKVDLGAVQCIESSSADDTTQGGFEDPALPEPGEAFFYVIQSFDGRVESGYGYGSGSSKRVVGDGSVDCH
jgi:hypothetical protein